MIIAQMNGSADSSETCINTIETKKEIEIEKWQSQWQHSFIRQGWVEGELLYSIVKPPLMDTLNIGHLLNKGQDSEHQKVTFL